MFESPEQGPKNFKIEFLTLLQASGIPHLKFKAGPYLKNHVLLGDFYQKLHSHHLYEVKTVFFYTYKLHNILFTHILPFY